MKKIVRIIGAIGLSLIMFALVGCGGNKNCCDEKYLTLEAYEANGVAVDNSGVTLECTDCNTYVLGGSVKEADNNLLSAFNFGANETHIVSIKLSANKEVQKDAFSLEIKGPNKTNTFGKEGLDGDDYTYMLLAVDDISSENGYSITVKWNSEDEGTTYTITASNDLTLE